MGEVELLKALARLGVIEGMLAELLTEVAELLKELRAAFLRNYTHDN